MKVKEWNDLLEGLHGEIPEAFSRWYVIMADVEKQVYVSPDVWSDDLTNGEAFTTFTMAEQVAYDMWLDGICGITIVPMILGDDAITLNWPEACNVCDAPIVFAQMQAVCGSEVAA